MLGALWMLLSEYLPFFSYLNRPLPWGPTYHNPLMWGKFSLDFEKIMKIFRKKSEGDRKKKVFSENFYFSSIICIRAPAHHKSMESL